MIILTDNLPLDAIDAAQVQTVSISREQLYADLMDAKQRISLCFSDSQAYAVRVRLLRAQQYLDAQASAIAELMMGEES